MPLCGQLMVLIHSLLVLMEDGLIPQVLIEVFPCLLRSISNKLGEWGA